MQSYGKLNSNWKGGEIFDGKYIKILSPNHPSVQHLRPKHHYVGEHRLVVEKFLGRILEKDEHIHHKDGNKLNNKIENLEIVTKAEHNKLHKRVKEYLLNGGDPRIFSNKSVI